MICKYLLVHYTYFFGNCWHTCCQQASEEEAAHESIVMSVSGIALTRRRLYALEKGGIVTKGDLDHLELNTSDLLEATEH